MGLGVGELDDQDKQIVRLLNDLHDATHGGHAAALVREALQSLIQHTQAHFADEEWFLRHHAYPDFAAHKAEHVALIHKLLDAQEGYLKEAARTRRDELLDFLRNWIIGHIHGSDHEYCVYLAERKLARIAPPERRAGGSRSRG